MHISKHYEQNIIVGSFESIKVGLTIHSDKEIKTVEELTDQSTKLGLMAKQLVQEELARLKAEKEQNQQIGG